MVRFSLLPAVILFILVVGCHNGIRPLSEGAHGRSYFVSLSGDDNNPGFREKPWKSIARINSAHFKPGDSILFEGGSSFAGAIVLDSLDSGNELFAVTIGSWGKGKAIINGGKTAAINIYGCSFVSLKDLIVRGIGRKDGNSSDGILITHSRHIALTGIEISGFQHSGLYVNLCSAMIINDVHAHDNGFAGIHISGNTAGDSLKFENEDIYIGYCTTDNNPGDPTALTNHSGNGIVAASVRRGTIEYCEASNNGWDMPWTGNGPVGIWIWDCSDFRIQHCISHDNKTNPVAQDGGGFDLDGGVSNSVIQYCLSYNNMGAGIGLFEFGDAKPWENNTIRYNISYNDGSLNGGSVAIWRGSPEMKMRRCQVYNNTFYNSTKRGYSFTVENSCPGFEFRNNIFVYSGAFIMPGQKFVSELFQSNCYWNLSGNSSVAGYDNLSEWAKATNNEMIDGKLAGVFINPCLQNPSGCILTDPSKLNAGNLAAFNLMAGSPLINRGLDLKNRFNIDPGSKDIAGSALPQGVGFDIGASEFIKR